MNYNELIYLFVDGDADASQKESLFSAMSSDTELQKELQMAIDMKNSTAGLYNNTQVPVHLTSKIFSTAGITATTVAGGFIGKSIFSNLASWKFIVPVISSIVGAVVAGIGLYSMYQAKIDNFEKEIAELKKGSALVSENMSESRRTDTTGMTGMTSKGGILGEKKQKILNSNAISNKIDKEPVLFANLTNDVFQSVKYDKLSKFEALLKNDFIAPVENIGQLPVEADIKHFSVQLNGIYSLLLYPQRNITNSNPAYFNNISCGIGYNFNDNFSVGVKIGQESLPIYVADNNGNLGLRERLFWYGAYANLRTDPNIFNTVSEYFELFVGNTISGPYTKYAFGFSWQPDKRVVFSAGVESTMLIYRYLSVTNSTEKIGMNYGISVLF